MTRFERSVAFWLRAYPRRWRAVRAGEVTAVLADLAGPDARRLDARAAAGLVRGGWATRWREHPPLHTYLGYRFLELPIPARYRDWARDDLAGPLYSVRLAIAGSWFVWPMLAFQRASDGRTSGTLVWFLLFGTLARATAVPPYRRRRLARKHLSPGAGEVIAPGDLNDGLVPRYRRAASPILAATAVLLTVGAVAWSTSALLHGVRTVAVEGIVVAALVGLTLVPLVVGRLRRLLPLAPAQPYRVVYGLTPARWVSVAFWSVAIGVEAWLEISGRLVLLLSGVGGVVCWLALPGVLAAWWLVRRGSSGDVAVADVGSLVFRRWVPAVDALVPGLVPVVPTLVGTTVPSRFVVARQPAPRSVRDGGRTQGGRR